MCSLARFVQCFLCCQCMGCCGIKPSVGYKRFLINFTKLLALCMIALTLGFITLTINEQIGIGQGNGSGQLFFKDIHYPPLPK